MIAWEPTEDDLAWTREQLDALDEGHVWNTGEVQYQHTGDKQLLLLTRTERAAGAHERICTVLDTLGWTCVDDAAVITPDDPVEQLIQAQQFAKEWRCPNDGCETLLIDCALEGAVWVNHGLQLAVAPDGTETEAERWLVDVACVDCSSVIAMNPLDYALIAGDDLFHTFRCDGLTYRVLSREATIALIDSGGNGVALGSRGIRDESIPPHIQGAFCAVEVESRTGQSEEE